MKETLKRSWLFIMIITLMAGFGLSVSQPETANAAVNATNARIHFINFKENCDAILLECNGAFGMVDSGEDSSYPNGKDSRYPWRSGITRGHGVEKDVISYLQSMGVKRLDFYIGTHPHSDHMGSAYDIIKRFKPKRVYLRPYKDSYITDKTRLWDNRYVYDRAIKAVKEVNAQAKTADEGITLIQSFSTTAKYVDPVRRLTSSNNTVSQNSAVRKPSSTGQKAKPTFTLGNGMTISLANYNAKLKAPDANYFCMGVKVTANGKKAFLAGDINNYNGTEDRLARKLGRVDVLKLGHHGYDGSNSTSYLKKLKPKIAVLMGTTNHCPQSMFATLTKMGTRVFATPLYASAAKASIVTMGQSLTINIQSDSAISQKVVAGYSGELKRYILYRGGKRYTKAGWVSASGNRYYISSKTKKPVVSKWLKLKGKYYYFRSTGSVAKGWFKLGATWYYSDSKGVMQTGWKTIQGEKYYFIKSGKREGAMVTGDIKLGKYWYYFREKRSKTQPVGSMYTGWLNNKYYYDDNGRYIKNRNKTGWQTSNSGVWYRYKNGKYPRKQWKTIQGNKYYFNASGYRVTGLQTINGNKYYFTNSGVMQKNLWQTVNGRLYYFANSGVAAKGWKARGNDWYYFNNLCQAVSGQQTLNSPKGVKNCIYYFNPQTHVMSTGWVNVGNNIRYYFFSSDDVKRYNGNVIQGNKARRGGWNLPTISNPKLRNNYSFDTQGNWSVITVAPAAASEEASGVGPAAAGQTATEEETPEVKPEDTGETTPEEEASMPDVSEEIE